MALTLALRLIVPGLLLTAGQVCGSAVLFRLGEAMTNLGPGIAQAINNRNQVVINTTTNTLVYTPNTGTVDIGSLGGGRTYGSAINEAGMVVGNSYTAAGVQHAFVWSPSTGMVDLGIYGTASGINNSGQVVGYEWTAGSINPVRSFTWSQASGVSRIGSPYSNTWLFGINDSNQTAGSGFGPNTGTTNRAFLYSFATGFLDLDLSPWVFRRPIAISDAGMIVGYVSDNNGGNRAFTWSATSGAYIFPAGTAYEATGVSDVAGVIGSLYQGAGILLTPDGRFHEIPVRPTGINDAGYIVGQFDFGPFEAPEPSSWVLLLAGCGLAAWRLGRRLWVGGDQH